jgi:hypothetical protein
MIYDMHSLIELIFLGVDDINMCELSLDETGLSSKAGAEILEKEFEDEWHKYGGREHVRLNAEKITSKHVTQLLRNY